MSDRDLTVHSDGYYHPKSGPLAGFVVERNGRVVLSEGSVAVDLPDVLRADSTAVEYWALGYAARRAVTAWPPATLSRTAFFVDSKSIVSVVLGASRIKSKYEHLLPWVLAGLNLSTWTLDWIPRAENARADLLSRADPSLVRLARPGQSSTKASTIRRRRACEPRHIKVGTFAMADLARVLLIRPDED